MISFNGVLIVDPMIKVFVWAISEIVSRDKWGFRL